MKSPVDASEVALFRRQLLRWHRKHNRDFPWRNTEDSWKILLSEILLQKTPASRVASVFSVIMDLWPTMEDQAGACEGDVQKVLLPLGLPKRAGEIIEIARDIVQHFSGVVPCDSDSLRSMKGVGEYTASAVRVFACGMREPIIDTNVVRILKRLFALEQSRENLRTSKGFHKLAASLVSPRKPKEYNYALLDFGALVCTHRNPKCASCPLRKHCLAPGII